MRRERLGPNDSPVRTSFVGVWHHDHTAHPSNDIAREKHVGIVYEGSGSHLVFEKISIDQLLKR